MDIILVRHGKTEGNLFRRYSGRTDEPLCREGVEHAKASGADQTVPRVYVSPMRRALETARIKFPNAAQTVCPDLREMDFGDFEGKTADELQNDADYTKWVESNCTLPCPNGEQMDAFADRICRAFDGIVRESIENNDNRLVVVAHGGSIMAILSRYGRPERQYYDWYVDNCCGYRARLDGAAWETEPVLSDCEKFETLP
ncbi:alpha-ribazole phosphatase [Sporobacter termitidis DSM 10068]|uniref:Alpha-ribazole phosphatase n=1 Tax=Sporobacter termitidis DSM 10068 TaxID=1123282 RepID=A0A1M5X3C8_9FIRM|nr:histidine phosphatase family protein [Sporobacter termitidis]SHH94320.1 alpha-ribazole phosphatase [Sporobacter termitidis DSM 10068]